MDNMTGWSFSGNRDSFHVKYFLLSGKFFILKKIPFKIITEMIVFFYCVFKE